MMNQKGVEKDLVIVQGKDYKHYIGCSICGTQLVYKWVDIRPWGHWTRTRAPYCPQCQKKRNANTEIIIKFETRQGYRWIEDPKELEDYNKRRGKSK